MNFWFEPSGMYFQGWGMTHGILVRRVPMIPLALLAMALDTLGHALIALSVLIWDAINWV